MNTETQQLNLDAIQTRDDAATPGPWGLYDDGTGLIDIAAELEDTGHGYRCRRYVGQLEADQIDNDPAHSDWTEEQDRAQSAADAAFIAAARTDVPALVAEVRRLRAERDQFADRVDTLTAVAKGNKRHVAELLAEVAKLEAEQAANRDRYEAGLRHADEQVNAMSEELKRYADGEEQPVLWSVYNAMHSRAATAEGCIASVLALCDKAEKQASRWENPLPVPEWVAEVRRATAPAARSAAV